MKNPLNDMISLLPLQKLIFLTYVQGKLHAFISCSIFHINSLYIVWILQQVLPKLLRLSICIELIVTLVPTIP
ncbi:hypothetical protein B296_00056678 [Ensete ventricosum]|uniref:Uncharacterized protein n=1 Tax=Ensete ventricosum TaxID=4639 RepID=A0A426XII4_ENSVE|nr:hypothetical protein B296_00056678 [Ensete ventricosum]